MPIPHLLNSPTKKKKKQVRKGPKKSEEPESSTNSKANDDVEATKTIPILDQSVVLNAVKQLRLSEEKAEKQFAAGDTDNLFWNLKILDQAAVEEFQKLSVGSPEGKGKLNVPKGADVSVQKITKLLELGFLKNKELSERQEEFCVEAIGMLKVWATMEKSLNFPRAEAGTISKNVMARAAWIEQHSTVRDWYESSTTRILIVNGCEPADGAVGPTGVWSTKFSLVDNERWGAGVKGIKVDPLTYKKLTKRIYIPYWCARATDKEAKDAIAYILALLLSDSYLSLEVPDFELPEEKKDKDGKVKKKYVKFSFSDLLELLIANIRKQLEISEVWVVLDQVSFYTGKTRQAEMKVLFNRLAEVAKSDTRCVMRLAATSHDSTDIAAGVPEAKIVNALNAAQMERHIALTGGYNAKSPVGRGKNSGKQTS